MRYYSKTTDDTSPYDDESYTLMQLHVYAQEILSIRTAAARAIEAGTALGVDERVRLAGLVAEMGVLEAHHLDLVRRELDAACEVKRVDMGYEPFDVYHRRTGRGAQIMSSPARLLLSRNGWCGSYSGGVMSAEQVVAWLDGGELPESVRD